jgi:rhodanese-related sulfurtransferase
MRKRFLILLISFHFMVACANVESETKENSTSQNTENTKTQNVDVAKAKELIAQDITILDVRTLEETSQGKIEGAICIDFYSDTFAAEIDKLDKTKPILVYCRSGGRSASAGQILEEKGFSQVYNLLGGYTAWSNK